MGKTLSVVAAFAVLAVAASAATPSPEAKPLRSYLAKTHAAVRQQNAALTRLDRELNQPPDVTIDLPVVFWTASEDFKGLARGWRKIEAPRPLHTPHTGAGRSLRLTARAFRILGDGYARYEATQDPNDLNTALDRARPVSERASELYTRWTKAVRVALRRAHLSAPRWLLRKR